MPDEPVASVNVCAVCGAPARVRYKDASGECRWYCADHPPAPPGADAGQWAALQGLFRFYREHKRMPSPSEPEAWKLVLTAISSEPDTRGFDAEFNDIMQRARSVADAPRRMRIYSRVVDVGCLATIAFPLLGALVGIGRLIWWLCHLGD
jgi:hypothetical protein